MTQRPFGIGCQPKGHTGMRNSNKANTGYHSVVFYDRPLTKEEIYSFELTQFEVVSFEVYDHVNTRDRATTIESARDYAAKRLAKTGFTQYIQTVKTQPVEVVFATKETKDEV